MLMTSRKSNMFLLFGLGQILDQTEKVEKHKTQNVYDKLKSNWIWLNERKITWDVETSKTNQKSRKVELTFCKHSRNKHETLKGAQIQKVFEKSNSRNVET